MSEVFVTRVESSNLAVSYSASLSEEPLVDSSVPEVVVPSLLLLVEAFSSSDVVVSSEWA